MLLDLEDVAAEAQLRPGQAIELSVSARSSESFHTCRYKFALVHEQHLLRGDHFGCTEYRHKACSMDTLQ